MMSIEEIKRELIEEYGEDEEIFNVMSDEEILRLWKALRKINTKRNTGSKKSNDVWEWENVPVMSIADAVEESKGVVEVRGVVGKIRQYSYDGCPEHRSKVKEINGEYYCPKCGEPVNPVKFYITKFLLVDDTGEIWCSTFPQLRTEMIDVNEGDYVAVRGFVDRSPDYGISFSVKGVKVIIKKRKNKKRQDNIDMKSDVGVEKEKVNDRVSDNDLDMDDEEKAMFDIIKYRMSQLLRRKGYLKLSQIRFIARGYDIDKLLDKFFDEEEVNGQVVYVLKEKYKNMLEEEGYL